MLINIYVYIGLKIQKFEIGAKIVPTRINNNHNTKAMTGNGNKVITVMSTMIMMIKMIKM